MHGLAAVGIQQQVTDVAKGIYDAVVGKSE
jgi:hypothetical protein